MRARVWSPLTSRGVAGMGEKSSSETGPRRTLFVRNLPYSISDEQLSAVFGKYGPIKSCFTVKDKGALQIERTAVHPTRL